MELTEFLAALNSGAPVEQDAPVRLYMHEVSQEALRLTAELNGRYHSPEEIQELFSRLIGKPVDEGFGLFPPFYTDCGKNITLGRGVFINSGCHFQDQGGIIIGDGTQIGHSVVLATLGPGPPDHPVPVPHCHRQECLDRSQRHGDPRRDHRGRGRRGRRGGGDL